MLCPPFLLAYALSAIWCVVAHATNATANITNASIGTGPILLPILGRVVGHPSRQNNVLFLSAGYQSNVTNFTRDVKRAMKFLQYNTTHAQPFKAYFTTFNVFVVWSPRDSIGCVYPEGGLDGTLQCDRARTMTLRGLAPVADDMIIIVLFNNGKRYGGSNNKNVVVTYTGDRMGEVLLHHLGHSVAHLSDESIYGKEAHEPGEATGLTNCFHSSEVTKLPWKDWYNSTYNSTLAGTLPHRGCGYTNYFRPAATCAMQRGVSAVYCPVCMEAIVLSLYKKDFDLLAPRCPFPNEVVYLKKRETLEVRVDERVLSGLFSAKYVVRRPWIKIDNRTEWIPVTAIPFRIHESDLEYLGESGGTWDVDFQVSDHNLWVLPQNRPPTMAAQNSTFRIEVVVDDVTRFNAGCGRNLSPSCATVEYNSSYCFTCPKHTTECSINLVPKPQRLAEEQGIQLQNNFSKKMGLVAGASFAASFAFLSFLIWSFGRWSRGMIQTVEVASPINDNIRIGILVLSCALLMFCGGSSAACFNVQADLYFFGSYPVIVMGILAAVKALWTITVFAGAYFKSTILAYFTYGTGIFLNLSFMVVLSVTFSVEEGLESKEVKYIVNQRWRMAVQEKPQLICNYQNTFHCSGFQFSCSYNAGRSVFCPKNCTGANQNVKPCWSLIREQIKDGMYKNHAISMTILTGSLFLYVLSILLVRYLRTLQSGGLAQRCIELSQELVDQIPSIEEILAVKRQFDAIDAEGSGFLEGGHMFRTIQNARAAPLSEEHFLDIFRSYDVERDGRFSLDEFTTIYCELTGRRSCKSLLDYTVLAPEEAERMHVQFQRKDVDGSGTMDRDEFPVLVEAVLDVMLPEEEMLSLFDLLDMDKTGSVTFPQFLMAFNPHVQLKYFVKH